MESINNGERAFNVVDTCQYKGFSVMYICNKWQEICYAILVKCQELNLFKRSLGDLGRIAIAYSNQVE
jgi:hypothetical protein